MNRLTAFSFFLFMGIMSHLNAAALVGTLSGGVAVNNTGSATYSMPISLPAGIAGMAPELGITYDSSGGNGLLGMGFGLDGLSAISRTSTTLEQDGLTDGIDFDDNDRFSLDGQRLNCVAGVYGDSGSEYRTEIDSFVRVKAYGTATSDPDSGPNYFIVETKAGLKKTYGSAVASSLTFSLPGSSHDGVKITWLLEKIEDTNGNAINFTYLQDSNSQARYISEISYGDPSHLMKVTFEYESRMDELPSYLHGVDFKTTKRLSKIRVYSFNTILHAYTLAYDYSPQRPVSRLLSVTYTDVATGDSLSSTFEWSDLAAVTTLAGAEKWYSGFGSSVSPGNIPDRVTSLGTTEDGNKRTWAQISSLEDIDGDGLLDHLLAKGLTGISGLGYNGNHALILAENTGSVFDNDVELHKIKNESIFTESFRSKLKDYGINDGDDFEDSLISDLVDIDGDGDLDLLKANYAENTGSKFRPNWVTYETPVCYFNIDGVFSTTPTILYDSALTTQNMPLWKYRDSSLTKMIDMNGDGLLDRVHHADYTANHPPQPDAPVWVTGNNFNLGLYVSINTGGAFATPTLWFSSSLQWLNYPEYASDNGNVYSGLLDINADGLPDKVDYYNPDAVTDKDGIWVSINNKDGFEAASPWFVNAAETSQNRIRWGELYGSAYAMFIDMNGDGLPDRVYDRKEEGGSDVFGLWVSINTGSSFAPLNLWYQSVNKDEQNRPQWSDINGVKSKLVDMNGDGLPDRVDDADYDSGSAVSGLYVSINNGAGFDPKALWFTSSQSKQCQPQWISTAGETYSDFLDVNGDGLPDKIDHRNYASGVNGMWVSINNREGFEDPVKWSTNQNLFLDSNQEQTTTYSELKDINGDGFPDRLYGNDGIWVKLNQSQPTLLSKVTNSFGVSTEIAYKPLTDDSVYVKGVGDNTPPTITIQTPMRVVSSISKDSGVNDINGDPIPYVTEYTYAEARYHTRGRGFLGFRVFESYDVQTQLTKTEILRHDFPFTGMKEATKTYGPNGQLLSMTENFLPIVRDDLDPQVNEILAPTTESVFPHYKGSVEWKAEYDPNYDATNKSEADLVADLKANAYGKTVTANSTTAYQELAAGSTHPVTQEIVPEDTYYFNSDGFDAYGNILRIFIDYGDGYTQLTENTYDNSSAVLDAWHLGRLLYAKVTSTAPDTTSQDETIIRESQFGYDSNGLLYWEWVEPNDAELSVFTLYSRDVQGRIVSSAVYAAPNYAAITTETHSNLDSTGRFYTTTTNALGHSETRVYDATRGWVTSQTGPNGRSTYFQYDALGRATREDRPDGTWSTTTYAFDDSQIVTNPDNALSYTSAYSVTSTGLKAPSSTTWYDRLGRAIRSCTEGFDGQIIYQDTGYNALGQVDCVSENYYAGSSPTLWTKTTFDDLGRPLVATAPDGTKSTTIYNGRETTSIRNYQGTDTVNPNANDQTTKTLLNAKGDTQTVTSYNQAGQPLVLTYRYDGVGNLLETEDPEGNIVSMTYDIRGNKTGMVDPDMGTWGYTYNALGQLVTQTDAVGNITTKVYDNLGRVTEESYDAADPSIATVTHNFYYDGTGEFQQLGKLHLEKSSTGFRRSYYYDDLGRGFLTLSKIEGRWFYQQTDYDSYSRPVRLTHYWRPPSLDDAAHDHFLAWYSYSQETLYDDRSFVTEVRDANGQTWWSDPEYNVHGQLVSYLSGNPGNTLETKTEYNDLKHIVERIYVEQGGINNILDHSYEFDSIGNFTKRTKHLAGGDLVEDFAYDKLNRLTSSSVSSGDTLTMAYNDLGDITSRTSTGTLGHVGAYTYIAGTHRVSAAGGRGFAYDANGSITGVSGSSTRTITWSAFNKPYTMEANNKRSAFSYDTGNSRVTQTRESYDIAGSQWLTNSRKTYVGALFEQEQAWNETGSKWDITSTRIYISTPAGVVGSWIDNVGASEPTKTIFHRDHLGSVIAESNLDANTPAITKEFSYDAWGLARDASDWTDAPATDPDRIATDRGFTGHEMLDDLGLIHMNGRIYDPLLGRFLSADPNIQSPSNLQNYNRYSYVLNNPVSITDPSGFFFKKLFKSIAKFLKKFATTIVAIVLVAFQQYWALAIFQITMGAIAGGFKGALIAAASIAVTIAIGAQFGDTANILDEPLLELARATSHGIAQGGFSELSGGDFGSSFLSGFSGSIAGSMMHGSKTFGKNGDGISKFETRRVVAAAVVGGTVSEIGGGKFANGAVTGAMVQMFNHDSILQKKPKVFYYETDPTASIITRPYGAKVPADYDEILTDVKLEVDQGGNKPIKVIIGGHGNPGQVTFFEDDFLTVSSFDLTIWNKYQSPAVDFVRSLGEILPRGSEVEYFHCNSGKGSHGALLTSTLQNNMGSHIKVITQQHYTSTNIFTGLTRDADALYERQRRK